VLQQLAVGVSSLSVLSSTVVHQLHSISHAGSRLAAQLDQLLGWAGKQERQSRLAAQQALGERCGQLGMGLLLAGLAVAAVRVGRLWEVHQVRWVACRAWFIVNSYAACYDRSMRCLRAGC
jgi:hypothetical protein